jgi:hypothetical protein
MLLENMVIAVLVKKCFALYETRKLFITLVSILTHIDPVHIIALIMEAVTTSETLLNICHTAGRNIPKDGHLHCHTLFL